MKKNDEKYVIFHYNYTWEKFLVSSWTTKTTKFIATGIFFSFLNPIMPVIFVFAMKKLKIVIEY